MGFYPRFYDRVDGDNDKDDDITVLFAVVDVPRLDVTALWLFLPLSFSFSFS